MPAPLPATWCERSQINSTDAPKFGTKARGEGSLTGQQCAGPMPYYYFDLCVDGQNVVEADGLQVAELRDGRFEGAVTLAEMIVHAITEARRRSMEITIRDRARKPLARVFMSIGAN